MAVVVEWGWGVVGGHYPRMCRDSCPDLSSEWEEERKKGGQINRERWPRVEERSREWMEKKGGETLDGLLDCFRR